MPLIPFVKNGYYGSRAWTPLVKGNGLTAGGGEPEPPTPEPTYTTVTGIAPLALIGAIQHDIRLLTQFGKCTQASTPTPDAPADIVCNNGALRMLNLADMEQSNLDIGYYINNNGVRTAGASNFYTLGLIAVKPSTAYTMHTSASVNYFNTMEYDASKGFIKRTLYGSSGTPAGDTTTFTTGATTAYIRFGSNIDGTTLDYAKISAVTWMLSEGVTAKEYVPYGTLYADGTPEVLTVGGKNLNGGTLEHIGFTSTGSSSTSDTFAGTGTIIPCVAGEKYTVSFGGFTTSGISGVFVNTWKTDGTFNMRQAISSSGETTYTIPEGVNKVNFTLYKTGGATIDSTSWMQVERGASATPYEPYVEPQTVTDIPMLLGVSDYADEAEIIGGIKTGKVGVKVLDGTESISTSNACFTIPISGRATSKTALLCSHFPYSSKTSSQTEDETIISFSSTNIGFRYDACADKTAFAAFLAAEYAAGTPVIVVYPLAEETAEQGTAHALHTTAGDNVVSVTSNVDPVTLEVEYANGYE